VISGSALIGTEKNSHRSALHCAVCRSYNRVRDALVASVMCSSPRVMRAMRYESTVPIATRPDMTCAQVCGSFSRTHAIFDPLK